MAKLSAILALLSSSLLWQRTLTAQALVQRGSDVQSVLAAQRRAHNHTAAVTFSLKYIGSANCRKYHYQHCQRRQESEGAQRRLRSEKVDKTVSVGESQCILYNISKFMAKSRLWEALSTNPQKERATIWTGIGSNRYLSGLRHFVHKLGVNRECLAYKHVRYLLIQGRHGLVARCSESIAYLIGSSW